jgi:hypothetical protein
MEDRAMESDRFDGLVRSLGQRRSRRQTLRGLAGAGAFVALLGATQVAAGKPGKPGNNKPGGGQNGQPGNSPPGSGQNGGGGLGSGISCDCNNEDEYLPFEE